MTDSEVPDVLWLARELGEHVERFAGEMPRDAAVTWVYLSALAAWAEDHGLIDPWLRQDAKPRRDAYLDSSGERGWLTRAIASLAVHPGTWTLLDPAWTRLREGTPSEAACRDLTAWWAQAPALVSPAAGGPPSISGWVAGDLLQHLSAERRKRHALVQTPWWIADGILDLTLVPAAGEFAGETLRVIDPCCGTGHFLSRAISYLWEWYTTGTLMPRQMKTAGVAGGTPVSGAEAIRLILAGLHGTDIDPLTAAVARLRYTVAIGSLMHGAGLIPGPLRLDAIPHFEVPVFPADSLAAGACTPEEYAGLHPHLAAIVNLGDPGLRPAQGALFDPGHGS